MCPYIHRWVKSVSRKLQHQKILRNCSDTVSARKEQKHMYSQPWWGICCSEKASFHVEWKVREGRSGSSVRLGISKHPSCSIWIKFYYWISHVSVVLSWGMSKISVFYHACFPFPSLPTTVIKAIHTQGRFHLISGKTKPIIKKNADLKFSRKPLSNNTTFQMWAATSGENPAV